MLYNCKLSFFHYLTEFQLYLKLKNLFQFNNQMKQRVHIIIVISDYLNSIQLIRLSTNVNTIKLTNTNLYNSISLVFQEKLKGLQF